MSRSNNMLKGKESFALMSYVKEEVEAKRTSNISMTEFADQSTRKLKFKVTKHNVKTALKNLDILPVEAFKVETSQGSIAWVNTELQRIQSRLNKIESAIFSGGHQQ